MKLSDLQYLMHQLGPATPEVTTIIQEAIDSWMVEFDEGVSMQIAWDERSQRVLMKCAIGQPDETSREDIYALLLNANLQLTGVTDVKFALSGADDDVILIGEYALKEQTLEALQVRLSEFLGFAGKFSRMIANVLSADSAQEFYPLASMHHDQA